MSYYIISIGGTGSKCVESLTHLCAAGFMPDNQDLYVMSVDPDTANGNVNRTNIALKNYEGIQTQGFGNSPMFKTHIGLAEPFVWTPIDKLQNTLDTIFAFQNMKDSPSAKLYQVLYSDAERAVRLDEGFRGHPSIGAAVMAKRIQLGDFRNSAAEWQTTDEDDDSTAQNPWDAFRTKISNEAGGGNTVKIFLVGSIFGGTGASGIPTIANLLRQNFDHYCNNRTVMIGGALILPYFQFVPDSNTIRRSEFIAMSENFLTNTQAALKYYSFKNSFEDIFNTLYFIGDETLAPVDNFCVGARNQENNSHIVETYAAFAAAHFFGAPKHEIDKRYAVIARKEKELLQWLDLPHPQAREMLGQLVRFVFAYLYICRPLLKQIIVDKSMTYKIPWYIDYFVGAGISVNDADIQKGLEFTDAYALNFIEWIKQVHAQKDGCRTELINWNAFKDVSSKSVSLNSLDFPNLIIGDTNRLTIDMLWAKMCDYTVKDPSTKGLGRFLRALYDCCA